MKAGIITFHQALNYGAVLQTYALQQALYELGVSNDVIDYSCEAIKKDYDGIIFPKCHRKKEYINAFSYYNKMQKRRKAFKKFLDSNISISEACDKGNIAQIENNYDCFISGSDQVFNDRCTNLDKAYFLDFVSNSKKKNSYAASFGFQQVPDGLEDTYKKLLGDFNNISVREEHGKKIVSELTGKEAIRNVDPTLILDPKHWMKLVKDNPSKEKYIFIYTVMDSKNTVPYAVELAKKKGYKIIFLHGTIDTGKEADYGYDIEHLYSVAPDEFLNYIYHADYVITNSFHGTVFSIVYKKKFMVDLQTWKYNKRSEELLQSLNIAGHTINDMNVDLIDEECDWAEVDKRLEIESARSKEYLADICRED